MPSLFDAETFKSYAWIPFLYASLFRIKNFLTKYKYLPFLTTVLFQ